MPALDASQPTLEDLKFLTEVSQLLTLLDLDSVMQRVLNLTSAAVASTRASLILRHDEEVDWDHIFLMRQLNQDESMVAVRAVFDDGLAGWVMRNKCGTIVEDTRTDSRWHVFPDEEDPAGSALCAPFIYDNTVMAILTLVHPQPGHFTEHDLRLVTIVANQATMALRNAQLFNRVQAQQHQLEVVLHAIPEILLVLDFQGVVLLANESAHQFLKVDAPLVGRSLADFADQDSALAPIGRIIARGAGPSDQWTFEARSEQTERDFQITMSMWENAATRTQGYIAVLHDVTTLRDLHRFKDDMLKIVTHDLRNPVALIATANDMLKMDLEGQIEGTDIPQYLDIIDQGTGRMNELLDKLLSAETSSRQYLDPVVLIEACVSAMGPLIQRRRQTVRTDLQLTSIPQILVDPMLLREAIDNYISNAIKYTPEGGHITVCAYPTDGFFCFEVSDDGIGISAADLPQVFEPYFRADRPETEEIEGYGVGLSLVKTIIERHKGQVWVRSTEGKGSTFGFRIPL